MPPVGRRGPRICCFWSPGFPILLHLLISGPRSACTGPVFCRWWTCVALSLVNSLGSSSSRPSWGSLVSPAARAISGASHSPGSLSAPGSRPVPCTGQPISLAKSTTSRLRLSGRLSFARAWAARTGRCCLGLRWRQCRADFQVGFDCRLDLFGSCFVLALRSQLHQRRHRSLARRDLLMHRRWAWLAGHQGQLLQRSTSGVYRGTGSCIGLWSRCCRHQALQFLVLQELCLLLLLLHVWLLEQRFDRLSTLLPTSSFYSIGHVLLSSYVGAHQPLLVADWQLQQLMESVLILVIRSIAAFPYIDFH